VPSARGAKPCTLQQACFTPASQAKPGLAMWRNARIAVIVPAFCEQRLIGKTLRGIPRYVDAVYAVDDASPDQTALAVLAVKDSRVTLLRHRRNLGVGAAVATGYARALQESADVLAVMAGDNQMHPDDLERVIAPIARGEADYAKGNRFAHEARRDMPVARRLAGRLLSMLTRVVTGLDVQDTQCGYTALAAETARNLDWGSLWPRFGYPNDLLCMLAVAGSRVVDVPVRPVYADEQSGVRPWHVLSIAAILGRRWWRAGCKGVLSHPDRGKPRC
jgi:glycosyltransferase involved in cell wall biosynthesis